VLTLMSAQRCQNHLATLTSEFVPTLKAPTPVLVLMVTFWLRITAVPTATGDMENGEPGLSVPMTVENLATLSEPDSVTHQLKRVTDLHVVPSGSRLRS